MIEKEYYLWLSMIKDLHYFLLIRLLKAFHSISHLYHMSCNKEEFQKIFIQYQIVISNHLFHQLTDQTLKEKSHERYIKCCKQHLELIPIFSSHYPKELLQLYHPPYILICYGNLTLLKSKTKIYPYYKEYFSKEGKLIYEQSILNLQKTRATIISDNHNFCCKHSIFVIDATFDLKRLDKDNVYVFHFSPDYITKTELLCGLASYFVLPEAKYEKDAALMTDIFLELGKEILVFPGNIYNTNCYFSNFLIKEGATVITSMKDLLLEIQNNEPSQR